MALRARSLPTAFFDNSPFLEFHGAAHRSVYGSIKGAQLSTARAGQNDNDGLLISSKTHTEENEMKPPDPSGQRAPDRHEGDEPNQRSRSSKQPGRHGRWPDDNYAWSSPPSTTILGFRFGLGSSAGREARCLRTISKFSNTRSPGPDMSSCSFTAPKLRSPSFTLVPDGTLKSAMSTRPTTFRLGR